MEPMISNAFANTLSNSTTVSLENAFEISANNVAVLPVHGLALAPQSSTNTKQLSKPISNVNQKGGPLTIWEDLTKSLII